MATKGLAYTRVDNKITLTVNMPREELTRFAEGIFLGLDDAARVELLKDCKRYMTGESQPSEIATFIGDEINKART
jgi:hypothetical protein